MGQSNSVPDHHDVPIEQVSHEMALRFATKCYSHLEIAHFKDNFKTLADHQDAVEYWKEETLCRFLSIPNSLHAGPVVFQMATYLGCFPFPSLAPCILTREAMLKVITIFTGKYRKILKRGDQDKIKLLFRSMAVFDRRMSTLSPTSEKSKIDASSAGQMSADLKNEARSHATGFSVDEAIDDDEEEDDDELALAALDALDAIEVFREDQKKERKIRRSHIPAENFQKLLMLVLLFASATPRDNLASFSESLDTDRIQTLAESATAILNAFDVEYYENTVQYAKFVERLPITLPHLFRPLNPLFEHFLFSKNIDLSKKTAVPAEPTPERLSPIRLSSDDPAPAILNDTLLAQLSMSLEIGPTTSDASSSLFHCGAKFSPLYSTASHGTSMSSFSRQVLAWRASTIFLVSGTTDDNKPIIIGAYLPDQWKEKPEPPSSASTKDSSSQAAMFQLRPRHAIFRANPYNKTTPLSHFASKTGISLGCVLPAQSRVQDPQDPILGPVSLTVDADFARAIFQHDPDAGTGAFLTDPGLEEAQRPAHREAPTYQPKKIAFDVDAVEVWGVSFTGSGEDEIANQKKRLAWEEAEAERRRAVNFGGDKDGARALLEMAGLVGDDAHNRSGGSV